jgi:hypothetical protein
MLGFISSILAVHNDNKDGDRKVSKLMHDLCLAEVSIISFVVFTCIMYFIYIKCYSNYICAVTTFVTILTVSAVVTGFFVAYDGLLMYRYNNNQSLTNSDLIFSKVYIAIYTLMLLVSGKTSDNAT